MSLLRAPGSVLVYRIQIFSGPSKTALTVPHFVHRQVLTSKRLLGGLRDLEVDPGVPGGVLGGPGGSRGSPGGGPGVSRGGSRGVLRSLLVGSWADLGGSRAPKRHPRKSVAPEMRVSPRQNSSLCTPMTPFGSSTLGPKSSLGGG